MKYLATVILVICSLFAFSQKEIPYQLTKRINVENDDFGSGTKYTSKSTGLTILSDSDKCTFTWEIICIDAVPFSFDKVQISINGTVHNIPFNKEEYSEYTESVRTQQRIYSASKMSTTYVNEDRYISKITIDASKNLKILNSIMSEKRDTKIRFSGAKNIDGVFNKRKKAEIKDMLLIYEMLTSIDNNKKHYDN